MYFYNYNNYRYVILIHITILEIIRKLNRAKMTLSKCFEFLERALDNNTKMHYS